METTPTKLNYNWANGEIILQLVDRSLIKKILLKVAVSDPLLPKTENIRKLTMQVKIIKLIKDRVIGALILYKKTKDGATQVSK